LNAEKEWAFFFCSFSPTERILFLIFPKCFAFISEGGHLIGKQLTLESTERSISEGTSMRLIGKPLSCSISSSASLCQALSTVSLQSWIVQFSLSRPLSTPTLKPSFYHNQALTTTPSMEPSSTPSTKPSFNAEHIPTTILSTKQNHRLYVHLPICRLK